MACLTVTDTSAVVAMLNGEPEADPVRLMSTASYLETAAVIEMCVGEPAGRELPHARQRTASAGLNHGDCFSYALAKSAASLSV
jgi:ribonuclease VapC